MEQTGVVGFAFALRTPAHEPNPCNVRLGDEVARVADKYGASMTIVQWEVAKALRRKAVRFDREVGLHEDGSYLDTQGLWDSAKVSFADAGIHRIVPVAQPYLHLPLIKRMIRKDGFIVVNEPIGPIGYDSSIENTQWWTRSAHALTLYAAMTAVGFKHGHAGRQTA